MRHVVMLLCLLALAACGDDDDSGQSAAETEVCDSLQGFGAALDNVEGQMTNTGEKFYLVEKIEFI